MIDKLLANWRTAPEVINRRHLFSWGSVFGAAMLSSDPENTGQESSSLACTKHVWQKGNIWAKTAISLEEPEYYAPSGTQQLEICAKCGLVRVPTASLAQILKCPS